MAVDVMKLRQEIADSIVPEVTRIEESAAQGIHIGVGESGLLKKIVPALNDKYQKIAQLRRVPFREVVIEEMNSLLKERGYHREYAGGQVGIMYCKLKV